MNIQDSRDHLETLQFAVPEIISEATVQDSYRRGVAKGGPHIDLTV